MEESYRWKYRTLMTNETWDFIKLPKGRKTIGSKWVFHIKIKAIGDIDKYCSRLVTKGFSQTKRFDFNKTFAHIMKFLSIRILLALATILDLEVY